MPVGVGATVGDSVCKVVCFQAEYQAVREGERCERGLAEKSEPAVICRGLGVETQPSFTASASKLLLGTAERCTNFVSSTFVNGFWQCQRSPPIPFVLWIISLASVPKKRAPMLVKDTSMGCVLPQTSSQKLH